LNHREKRFHVFRIVQVRRYCANLAIYLSQRRTAKAVLARSEVYQNKIGIANVQLKLRR